MITKKELKKVNDLNMKLADYKDLLSSFSSPYVKRSVGIVDINSSSTNHPKPSEMAKFFNDEMKDFVKDLNEYTIKKIEIEIGKIELELMEYIEDE